MKSIIPYFLLGLSTIIQAQPTAPTPSWTKKVATDGRLNAIIENQNGELVAVGTTYVVGQRRDALWLLMKKDGTVLQESTINGNDNRSDEAFAVRQTLDGGYILVGTTQKRETGKTEAWLVKTNQNGTAILSKEFGTIGDDAFFDITEDNEGNIYAVGHQNGVLFLVKTDKHGKAIFQKPYEGTAIQNAALTWLTDGTLAIVGSQNEGKKAESFLKCLNTEGVVVWEKTLADVQINAMKRDRVGNLVLTGIGIKSKKSAEDMVILRVNIKDHQAANVVTYFGGEGRDIAQSLALDTEGGAYLVGNSTSMQNGGARAEDFCLLKVKGVEKAWKQPVSWGGAKADRGLGITITQAGAIISVGEQGGDALAMGFDNIALPKSTGATSLRIDQTAIVDDGNDNGILEENERGAIAFMVKNEGQNDAIDVIGDIQTTTKGIVFPQKISIGTLQVGESRRVGIPLSISPNIRAENGKITLNIKAENSSNTVSAQVFVPTQVSDKVDLAVASFQFSNTPIKRNQDVSLKVTIRNQGRKIAQGVRLSCILPNEINTIDQSINSLRFDLGDMPSNGSKTVTIDVKIPSFFSADSLIVKLSLREIGGLTVNQKEIAASLIPFEKDEIAAQKTTKKDSVVVQWLSPIMEEMKKKRMDYSRHSFALKVKALSNQPLNEQSFKVWLNGKPYGNGSKSDNIKLRASTSNSYRYAFNYVQNIELLEGENTLFVEVQNASGKGKSEEIIINKRPIKPTLHVLAIGVPHADLQFTTKDAADFAKICAAQEGKFFDKVNIVVKNTAAETTVESLRRSIRTLQLDFLESGTIKPEDLVIFFISSHGKSDKKNTYFKIAASDLQETFIGTTCLDFKDDILDILTPLNCKKLILLDACHSGAAATDDRVVTGSKSLEADIGNAIQRFVDAESELMCISSSSEREESYEDPKWQNGAFTEALIEGLSNTVVSINGKIEKADKDNDKFVELRELFDFISLRIPQMVKETIGKSQNPKIKGTADFPIFYIR